MLLLTPKFAPYLLSRNKRDRIETLVQYAQCRIKLLGGPVPNADGGPCPLSLPSPYPCRIPSSLPFKVGFDTYRHNDDKCTHTDYRPIT